MGSTRRTRSASPRTPSSTAPPAPWPRTSAEVCQVRLSSRGPRGQALRVQDPARRVAPGAEAPARGLHRRDGAARLLCRPQELSGIYSCFLFWDFLNYNNVLIL